MCDLKLMRRNTAVCVCGGRREEGMKGGQNIAESQSDNTQNMIKYLPAFGWLGDIHGNQYKRSSLSLRHLSGCPCWSVHYFGPD